MSLCVFLYIAVMSAGTAANVIAAASSTADVISSSSTAPITSLMSGSVVRPASWLGAGTCGLVIDPVLAMKLITAASQQRDVPVPGFVASTSAPVSDIT